MLLKIWYCTWLTNYAKVNEINSATLTVCRHKQHHCSKLNVSVTS